MSRRRGGKTLIITDDEEEKREEELNPFSFKEFLRWKDQNPDLDQDKNQDLDQNQNLDPVWRCPVSEDLDADVSSCFPAQEQRGRSLQPGEDSRSSLCAGEEGRGTRTRSRSWTLLGGNYEGDDETPRSLVQQDLDQRDLNQQDLVQQDLGQQDLNQQDLSQQDLVQQLRQENESLRRALGELQRNADDNQRKVSVLSEELLQRRRREEKEAQDLEGMVQSVEQNLQLMTRRAVKAEGDVSRLKAELQAVQGEADAMRRRLKADSQLVVTMRQNARLASEYLSRTAGHAHSSLRRLLAEADTLHLASQLLLSIDRMSTES